MLLLHRFTKGAINVPANCRPISITCVPCKLLERVVVSKIYEHLEQNNLFCRKQHGFIAGRSTRTKILECLNDWICNLQDVSVLLLL